MDNLPELYSVFQGEVTNIFPLTPQNIGWYFLDFELANWWHLIGYYCNTDEKYCFYPFVLSGCNGDSLWSFCSYTWFLEASQDERRRQQFRGHKMELITLEAVLNTVCTKCGCKGHFAKDCYVVPGGTKYELIPDDELPNTLLHLPEPSPDKGKAHKVRAHMYCTCFCNASSIENSLLMLCIVTRYSVEGSTSVRCSGLAMPIVH
uniref:CCHC-type domain-containing protein n=1 Tax=Eptatretus burgeri TaxID=7764 RepID=A0A8C4QZI8_EPTBU